ncbi:MAG: hypothetical protein J5873_04640 [Bacteroidales bacterium]|nr:hypothetical protein [Bacteroidales bacterium]
MKKRVVLKETEKITAYRPANFFAEQLVYARNKNLQQLMGVSTQETLRMREISRFGGVQFLDDSGCHDIHGLNYALESIQRPILWITGGADSQVNYTSLLPLVVEKVKAVVCIGEDNERLQRAFAPYVTMYECPDMGHAVKTAYYSAESGDVVLLSSACECDRRFANHQERSRCFREAVTEL